ncbi:HD domain-containing protein [Mycolicibacterium phocaicum]|nr:HD domain-containing protein [Mycolicibacterium phocaicum]BBZ53956.1 hypothetical protein MPHO_09480 [Mycolicibacterium phocaicum]
MAYKYLADGDCAVWRLGDGPVAPWIETFNPIRGWIAADLPRQAGDAQPVSEAEAMQVCDALRRRVATNRIRMTALEAAKAIAHREHSHQSDKAGQPYIGHVSRVAARVSDDHDAETVAWLHDVVEDTSIELSDLGDEFAPHVVAAVDAITRRVGEAPADYYRRVRGNDLARRVKLADIADNSDPVRLAGLDSATRERLERKYRQALEAVSA